MLRCIGGGAEASGQTLFIRRTMPVKTLQALLNSYFTRFVVPVRVKEDGDFGPETKAAIKTAKLAMGYLPKYASGARSLGFYARLKRPLSRTLFSSVQRERGYAYRRSIRSLGGLIPVRAGETYTDDGQTYTISIADAPNLLWWVRGRVAVAKWIAPQLLWAKGNGWDAEINNGWRSYEHQHYIYFDQSIRPAAYPGTSMHEGSTFPRGAVDVNDPAALEAGLANFKGPYVLVRAGDKDPPHFSYPHDGRY